MSSMQETDQRYNGDQANDEPTQLEFNQAMKDFRTMFPMLDDDVIEAVLRSNNGVVDSTIDQLLTMTVDCDDNRSGTKDTVSDSMIPSQVLEEQKHHTPSYSGGLPSYDDIVSGVFPVSPSSRTSVTSQTPSANEYRPKRPSQRKQQMFLLDDSDISHSSINSPMPVATPYPSSVGTSPSRRWNPPLLGKLPPDFLRISISAEDTHGGHDSSAVHSEGAVFSQIKTTHLNARKSNREQTSGARPKSSPSSNTNSPRRMTDSGLNTKMLMKKMQENKQKRMSVPSEHNPEVTQVLEDEYLALMLQNEEFLQELQQDEDFMMTLERDRMNATAFEFKESPSRRQSAPVSPQPPPTSQRKSRKSSGASNSSHHSVTSTPSHQSFTSSPLHQHTPLCPTPPNEPAEVTAPAPWANWELPEPPRIQTISSQEDLPILIDKEYCPEAVESKRNGEPNGYHMERPSEDLIVGYGDDSMRTLDAFPYSKHFPGPGNAEFRRQLKYMGKSSRKKFMDAAKQFFSRRKKPPRQLRKKPPRQLLKDSNAPSQMNLLENIEYDEKYNRPSPSNYTSFS